MKALIKHLIPSRYVLWSRPRADKSIAITIDDGPHPEHTHLLLDVLAQYDAKVTFFMVGKSMQAYPEVVHAVHSAGHEFGCHGLAHQNMHHLKKFSEIDHEIGQGYQIIKQLIDQTSPYYRPPYGNLSWRVMAYCFAKQKTIAMWSVDSLDYLLARQDPSVNIKSLTARLKNTIQGGDIVLFHDDSGYCVDMLKELLPVLKADGFSFTTLSELHQSAE